MEALLKKLGITDAATKLRVKTNLDFSKTPLTPEEGFLLSRVDVAGSIHELFQVSTFPAARTEAMLCRFADEGMLEVVARAATAKSPTARRPRHPHEGIEPAICFEIEDFFDRLQKKLMPVEILGLAEGAKPAQIKEAYVRLTKKFHPDRLFRREAGAYRTWLEFIFRELNRAYEELTQKDSKTDLEKAAAKGPKAPPNPLVERIKKAKQFLEDARAQMGKDPIAAYNTVKLALSFDPQNADLKKLQQDLEPRIQVRKSVPLFKKAQELEEAFAYPQAAEAYEQAAKSDPGNDVFQRACGEILLHKLKQAERALPYAKKAVELNSTSVDNQLLLGYALKAVRKFPEALLAFERAASLDKGNLFATNEVADLRKNLIISNKKR